MAGVREDCEQACQAEPGNARHSSVEAQEHTRQCDCRCHESYRWVNS